MKCIVMTLLVVSARTIYSYDPGEIETSLSGNTSTSATPSSSDTTQDAGQSVEDDVSDPQALSPISVSTVQRGNWLLSYWGYANLMYDRQGGRRGKQQVCSTNVFIVNAQSSCDLLTLDLRGSLSLEPGTVGKKGYPLLFALNDQLKVPLLDRMRPQDLFNELAASLTCKIDDTKRVLFYAGIVGNPPLGPLAFHNYSGILIPDAPIAYNWLDSTYGSYGTLLVGFIDQYVTLEIGAFNGCDSDEHHWDIQRPRINSYCARLSLTPSSYYSVQISGGSIRCPTADHQLNRVTASFCINKPWSWGAWYTSICWGRNLNIPGNNLDAFLFQSTAVVHEKHVLFGRLELISTDEVLSVSSHNHICDGRDSQKDLATIIVATRHNNSLLPIVHVGRWELGYMHRAACHNGAYFGLGIAVSGSFVPRVLRACYGKHPLSCIIFGHLETC